MLTNLSGCLKIQSCVGKVENKKKVKSGKGKMGGGVSCCERLAEFKQKK